MKLIAFASQLLQSNRALVPSPAVLPLIVLCLVSSLLTSHSVQAECTASTVGIALTTISCPDFGGDISILNLNGNAARVTRTPTNDPALRLAGTSDGCVSGPCCEPPGLESALYQSGTAWLQETLRLGAVGPFFYSFTTRFQFQITCSGGSGKAGGLTFALNTVSNSEVGSGGGLGYENVGRSVAIEFDIHQDDDPLDPRCNNDPNDNHIALDVSGYVTGCNVPRRLGYIAVTADPGFNLASGDVISAWVDYDGSVIRAYVAQGATALKPAQPIIAGIIDLFYILGTSNIYAGFTAGTGDGQANHDILNWYFKGTLDNQGPPITALNVPTTLATGTSTITVSGTATDAGRGDSDVTSVTYTLDGGSPVTITGISPAVTVSFQASIAGLDQFSIGSSHTLCFTATDAYGNAGAASCPTFAVVAPPGFCIASTGAPGVCAKNCGKGQSGCNCFDLQVVSGRCVPCASGVVGTPPNANCVTPDGTKAGSARAEAGATYCDAANPAQPCAVDTSCNNAGGQKCGSNGEKCCHY